MGDLCRSQCRSKLGTQNVQWWNGGRATNAQKQRTRSVFLLSVFFDSRHPGTTLLATWPDDHGSYHSPTISQLRFRRNYKVDEGKMQAMFARTDLSHQTSNREQILSDTALAALEVVGLVGSSLPGATILHVLA